MLSIDVPIITPRFHQEIQRLDQLSAREGALAGACALAYAIYAGYKPSEAVWLAVKVSIVSGEIAGIRRISLKGVLVPDILLLALPSASAYIGTTYACPFFSTTAAVSALAIGAALSRKHKNPYYSIGGTFLSIGMAYAALNSTQANWSPLVSVPAGVIFGVSACFANTIISNQAIMKRCAIIAARIKVQVNG